jgi:hypothetical protein
LVLSFLPKQKKNRRKRKCNRSKASLASSEKNEKEEREKKKFFFYIVTYRIIIVDVGRQYALVPFYFIIILTCKNLKKKELRVLLEKK